jgi:hypothetical protein
VLACKADTVLLTFASICDTTSAEELTDLFESPSRDIADAPIDRNSLHEMAKHKFEIASAAVDPVSQLQGEMDSLRGCLDWFEPASRNIIHEFSDGMAGHVHTNSAQPEIDQTKAV